MGFDFSEFFDEYEKLVAGVDKAFEQVRENFPHCVTCQPGCTDCCYALFDLFLVEALYLNHKLLAEDAKFRDEILKRADLADRQVHKIKKKLAKASEKGESTENLLALASKEKVRCPLLDEQGRCSMYDARPLTCRLYGIPTSINGQGHTCGKSGFEPGGAYPTVHLEKVQERLQQISSALADSLNSKYAELDQMLVPVSMALLSNYTPEYLGVEPDKEPAS